MIAIELDNDSEPKFLPQFGALSQLENVDVNAICRELSVVPISSFPDQCRFDTDEGEDGSTWYSAGDGARTFSALSDYFLRDPNSLQGLDPEKLRHEFDEVCELLINADQTGTKFHLIIAIMWPGSEELVRR